MGSCQGQCKGNNQCSKGTVKRDTFEEISGSIVNSVKDLVGLDEDNGIIEDLKIDVRDNISCHVSQISGL